MDPVDPERPTVCHDALNAQALRRRLLAVASALELDDDVLAEALWWSAERVEALRARSMVVAWRPTCGERARLLVGVHDALTVQLGRRADVRLWFETHNPALGARPRDRIQSYDGLREVFAAPGRIWTVGSGRKGGGAVVASTPLHACSIADERKRTIPFHPLDACP